MSDETCRSVSTWLEERSSERNRFRVGVDICSNKEWACARRISSSESGVLYAECSEAWGRRWDVGRGDGAGVGG